MRLLSSKLVGSVFVALHNEFTDVVGSEFLQVQVEGFGGADNCEVEGVATPLFLADSDVPNNQ